MQTNATKLCTIGIVDVYGAEPAAAAKRRLGGQTLLPWVVRRITDAERLDCVVAIIRLDDADDISGFLPPDVAIFETDHEEPLKRLVAVAQEFDADAIVHVQLDSPFIDPALIDGLIHAAEHDPQTDHVSYGLSDQPSSVAGVGLYAEWFRVDALQRADRNPTVNQGSNWEICFQSEPQSFPTRFLPVPDALRRTGLKLRLDDTASWDRAEEIIEALGPDEINWQRISRLVGTHLAK